MNLTRVVGAAAVAALSLSTLMLTTTSAEAKGGRVRVHTSGACSASTEWELKSKVDDGRLEVEFEVDASRKGQVWTVTLADNGTTFWTGMRTTRGRSGSFEVEKRTANQVGTDTITATASNAKTGETCSGSLVFPA
jgi:hypothetical protein